MRTRPPRLVEHLTLRSCAVLLVLLLPTGYAKAAGCLLAPAKLSDATITAFKQKPSELLDRFPAGGPAMSAEIMRRVGSDVDVLPEIVQIARQGTTAQRVAIGIGLARAATTCSHANPEIEQAIKQAVSEAALSELSTAFAAGLSSIDQATAIAASSEGASPVVGGPVASVGGGSDQRAPTVGGPASAASFLSTTISGSMRSFSTRALTSTTGDTVSPTRR